MSNSKSAPFNLPAFFKFYFKEIVAAVIFILAYVPTIMWMWDRWFTEDTYYSHGWLIPFVSIYLIYQKRDELKLIEREESPWGVWVIAFGLLIHFVSSMLRIYFSSGFSMLIVLTGFILYFWGGRILRKIWFPVFFLVFMVPLPMVIITNISFRLKLFAAEIGTVVLNQIGLPAVQQGSIIKMRTAQVVVDDVCSGLRSLISLTALGSIFAYWMTGVLWKKILLFLSTIPIAIVTNVCRVILLASISEIWGTEYAVGFVHDASGFMVFALAFALLFAVGKILE